MRLIDADAIPWFVVGIGEIPVVTKEEIEEMPTIDAVEVVRCKDCKWYEGCFFLSYDDDYCSEGERK